MNLLQRVALFLLMLFVAGCSSINHSMNGVKNSVGSLINGSHTLNTAAIQRPVEQDENAVHIQYAATLRVVGYLDQRRAGNPRLLGVNTQPVFGLDKGQMLVDQDMANLVTTVFRNRFNSAGYQVLEGSNATNAMFEVSGAIRELTLNIKDRDEVNIVIETTVKEAATGKVVWSGSVTERDDQYAGVFGNSKNDVVRYLNKELQLVGKKTVDAVSAVLPAVQPVTSYPVYTSRPVSGVTVNVAPAPAVAAPAAPSVAAPASTPVAGAAATAAVQAPEYVPHASATAGLLVVTTTPPRAKVYLDGVYFGMTPLRSEMKPSVHNVTVKLEGYKTVTEKISIRKGENTELELNLSR